MKLNFIKTYALIGLFVLGHQLQAQVTIGSSIVPNMGALLDLKQEDAPTPGGANSNQGLAMPRVELADLNKLQMGAIEILDTDSGGNQYSKHTGLVVFNTNEAAPFCKGLYVWDSQQWQRIGEPCTQTLTLSSDTSMTFFSGRNGTSITPIDVNASFSPATATLTWSTIGDVPLSTPTTFSTQQRTFRFSPAIIPLSEVRGAGGNPFVKKTGELIFTLSNNGRTLEQRIPLSQINKAITLSTITHESTANGSFFNTIRSNAKWQLAEIFPNNVGNAFSDIRLDGTLLNPNSPIDWERNDNLGSGSTNNLTYTVTTDATKARYSKLRFADAAGTLKRFNDISINLYQCGAVGRYPTMSEWAAIAGFSGVKEPADRNPDPTIAAAEDIAAEIDTPNPITGIAWHRDQDGNVFLSASFATGNTLADITGNSERWMITNLAAKNYASNVTHSAGRTLTGPSYNADFTDNGQRDTALWGYPAPTTGEANPNQVAHYTNNPRMGLIYTWDAATAGKGGITGQDPFDDGATPPTPVNTVQGICPNGWHLPNDYEYTVLENAISYRTSLFSSMADITPSDPNAVDPATLGNPQRIEGLPSAFIENCENGGVNASNSNPIGTQQRAGFNVLFVSGALFNSQGIDNATFWTSSSITGGSSWFRYVSKDFNAVFRGFTDRATLYSVRCKKTP